MTALLKSVWSFPSRLVRSLFVLIRLLFIVLISSKDMETMEFTVIMRIVKAMSVTPPSMVANPKTMITFASCSNSIP